MHAVERVLVVGLGSIGCRHARVARQLLPDAEIIALRRSRGGAVPTDVDRVVTTMEEAVGCAPHAAVVATPATMHLATALPLAQASVHLLVEKPLAGSSDGVADLIDACDERRLTLMTGYNLRYAPSLARFRERLSRGEIGRVLSVRAEVGQFLPSWRPGCDYRDTVSSRSTLGGGVLLELSHEIDYLRSVFGDVEWVSAVIRRQSALEIDVEDTAHLVLGFAPRRGERAVVASLNMDFVRHDTTRTCTAIGEAGSLRWNALAGTVEKFAMGADGWVLTDNVPAPPDATYVSEWQDFLACIGTSRRPRASGVDGLATLQVVDAARRSAAAGAVVPV